MSTGFAQAAGRSAAAHISAEMEASISAAPPAFRILRIASPGLKRHQTNKPIDKASPRVFPIPCKLSELVRSRGNGSLWLPEAIANETSAAARKRRGPELRRYGRLAFRPRDATDTRHCRI